MAIIMVLGRQVSVDPEFNAFATARFTRHNAEGAAEYRNPNDSSQRLSLNPTQYRRVLQAFHAREMERANGFVRDQRRFARTGSAMMPARPAEDSAPTVLVGGRPLRSNAGFANFVLGELQRNASYRPVTRDGRVVISLNQIQYDRASARYVRHLSAEAEHQHPTRAPQRRHAAERPIHTTARNENGQVTYVSDTVFTVTGG
jgi:hypothetical protein